MSVWLDSQGRLFLKCSIQHFCFLGSGDRYLSGEYTCRYWFTTIPRLLWSMRCQVWWIIISGSSFYSMSHSGLQLTDNWTVKSDWVLWDRWGYLWSRTAPNVGLLKSNDLLKGKHISKKATVCKVYICTKTSICSCETNL